MKKNIVIMVCALVILSMAVYSINKFTKIQLTSDISLEKIDDCKTIHYYEEEITYGTCSETNIIRTCDDEPFNNSCSEEEVTNDYRCEKGKQMVQKSKEICKDSNLEITVDKFFGDKKYKLEYVDWGKCSYESENTQVVVLCDSKKDGNNDGKCQPGESCIKFIINKDGVQRLLRNSNKEFTPDDNTFLQRKLSMEVLE